jgi:putative MATE family efflux protein
MNDKRIDLLKNAPVKKAINKMAMPAIIGLLVMAIYNVVDTMFVAWIGTKATGATQVVLPIMLLASAIGLAFGIGGGSYLSRLLGKGDMKKAEQVASTSFYTGLLAGLIFTVLCLSFFEGILTFFGANKDIMSLTKSYGLYIVLGSIVLVLNMVLNNLLRSEGSAKLSMFGMAAGAILNIVLDPLFIFVFDWGIAGAAIATTLSQCVTFVILISHYIKRKTVIHLTIKSIQLKWEIYKEILVVGTPTFFKQLLFSLSIALLNQSSITYGGADLLAATGVITRVTMLPTNIVFGLGQGFQPVAGYNIGAGDKKRVMDSLKYTIIISTIVMAITALCMSLFGKQIFYAFKTSSQVASFGIKGLRYYSLGLVLLGFTNTVTVFYQSLGKGRESLFMSVSRQGIFFIPAIIMLPKLLGINGVLMAQLVADILAMILSLIFIIPFIKKDKLALEFADCKL